MNPLSPAQTYRERLAVEAAAGEGKRRIHVRVAWVRVAVLVGFVVVAYEAAERRMSPQWLWLLGAGFVGLTMFLGRLAGAMARHTSAITYFEMGLRRIEGHWMDGAPTGEAFADEGHLFAADLDLFGRGGLFGLLCVARTSLGQGTLAGWLKEAASPQEIQGRQEAVRELAALPLLRENLWQCGARIQGAAEPQRLMEWLQAKSTAVSVRTRFVALGLAVAALPALWMLVDGQPLLALAVFGAQMVMASRYGALTAEATALAQNRVRDLELVADLVGLLESASFQSPVLRGLRDEVLAGGLGPKKRVQDLIRWVQRLDDRRNLGYLVITSPFLWGTQMALGIEAWRAQHGPTAARWIQAVGTVEALSSLGTFAYENPDYPFPQIVPDDQGPLFDGHRVAHPLLPRATRIANTVKLDPAAQLVLISGSNMSGKSTFLRTVGINTALALAGAPVCAESLRLSRLQIGATLRTQDSLAGGVSSFFAEIKRLRQIVALVQRSPLTLFLLDEILHGTNSQDRQTGGEALVKTLLQGGAIGLVTTHDLALTRMADDLAPRARNAHFQDRIEADTLVFDYTLRPGVVTRSNALDLMRLVGLKV